MIELGGNIKLEGFDNIEQSKLVVIKKIVGNFIKKLEAENKVAIILKLSEENSEFKINAELNLNEQNKISSVTEKNLFFALNNVLTKLNLWNKAKTL